ncbi:MAG: hypothetical protein ABIR33_02550 [Pyrinomonadaceae bacterium]
MSTTVLSDVNAQMATAVQDSLNEQIFGKKLGVFTRLFGCQHTNVSRPFGLGRSSYRACISCGARRQFDPRTLQTTGAFYSAPPSKI